MEPVPQSSTVFASGGAGESCAESVADGIENSVPAEDTEQLYDTVCRAEYFNFTSATNTITDAAGNALLYERRALPQYVSDDAQRSAWVGDVLDGIRSNYDADSRNLQQYAEEFIERNGNEHFYSHSNYQQLAVARHDERIVSLISLNSLYSGGTHPNSVQIAYNLDIANQRLLKLEDLILEDGAAALSKLVHAGVDEKFAAIDGGNGLFEDYADTIDNSMVYGNLTPYWYLNDVGLVIFYNQYELGPYAAGIIKIELPYESLDGILNEKYIPVERSGSVGELVLRRAPEEYHRIPITIEADGDTICVGVEGQVYQVQLSEIQWLDQMPIAQEMLFSAMTLCENDVLEISGGYTDDGRSFAIEYINGDGENRIVYIHNGELSEEP